MSDAGSNDWSRHNYLNTPNQGAKRAEATNIMQGHNGPLTSKSVSTAFLKSWRTDFVCLIAGNHYRLDLTIMPPKGTKTPEAFESNGEGKKWFSLV